MFLKFHTFFEVLLIIFTVVSAVPILISHNEKVFNATGTTDIKVTTLRYVWTINNLDLRDYINGQAINSSIFSAEPNDKCQWYLDLYPKGYSGKQNDSVSIYINSISCDITANIFMGIINSNNEHANNKEFVYIFTKQNNRGFDEFLKQDFLLNKDNGLLVNGSLTIFCEVKVKSAISNTSTEVARLPVRNDVGKDLAFLLDNEVFSDVKFSIDGKDIWAIKAILAARSPVFKSMFESVPNVRKVDITDVDADVAKEMLRYIYTGEVPNMEDFAPSLLEVAEKYELVGLKDLSENFISSKLSIENAVESFKLGDTYYAAYLRAQAKDFIAAHASEIILTNGFRSLVQTHPLLVEEIFSAVIKTH